MSFARDGFTYIAIAALITAVVYAAALNRRSWALWLVAFALTIGAMGVAYFFRDPHRTGTAAGRAVGRIDHADRVQPPKRMELIRYASR